MMLILGLLCLGMDLTTLHSDTHTVVGGYHYHVTVSHQGASWFAGPLLFCMKQLSSTSSPRFKCIIARLTIEEQMSALV